MRQLLSELPSTNIKSKICQNSQQDSSGGGLDLILEEKGGSQEGDEAIGTKDRSQAPNKEDVLRDLQGDDATDSTDESPPEDNNSAAVTE